MCSYVFIVIFLYVLVCVFMYVVRYLFVRYFVCIELLGFVILISLCMYVFV